MVRGDGAILARSGQGKRPDGTPDPPEPRQGGLAPQMEQWMLLPVSLGKKDQLHRTWHCLQWRWRWPGVPLRTAMGLWLHLAWMEESSSPGPVGLVLRSGLSVLCLLLMGQ